MMDLVLLLAVVLAASGWPLAIAGWFLYLRTPGAAGFHPRARPIGAKSPEELQQEATKLIELEHATHELMKQAQAVGKPISDRAARQEAERLLQQSGVWGGTPS